MGGGWASIFNPWPLDDTLLLNTLDLYPVCLGPVNAPAPVACKFLGKRAVGRCVIEGGGAQVAAGAGQGGPRCQGHLVQVHQVQAQVHRAHQVEMAALG